MSKLPRRASFWLAALVLLVFGVRAASGVVGGVAYASGATLAADGYYGDAIPLLERGAIGETRYEALWLLAEVRVGLWLLMEEADQPDDERREILRQSASDYLRAARVSPASGWSWAGLGNLFGRLEASQRRERSYELSALTGSPWNRVGEPGRMAVGMFRTANSVEGRSYVYLDWLFLTLLDLGLEEEAREALRQTAEVLPYFDSHAELIVSDLPDSFLLEFAGASESALGRTPLLSRERHLFSLGKLYRRLDQPEAAERFFRDALREPSRRLHRSEVSFHLAHVLFAMGQLVEAEGVLDLAEEADVFRAATLHLRSRIALERGDPERALMELQRARMIEPRNLALCLSYARLARRLDLPDRALEALRWAVLVHPRNLVPRVELVQTHLEQGDVVEAELALWQAHLVLGDSQALRQLEAEIIAMGGRPVIVEP